MRFIRRDPHMGYVDTMLYVPKEAVNVEGVKSALTFCLTDKQGATRYLQLWEETNNHIIVPRALWNPNDLGFEAVDCRPKQFPMVDISSGIVLDRKNPKETTQKDAARAILESNGGILQLRCGGGKSVVALYVAAQLSVPTLIIVDNNNLMSQWKAEIERHLTVPAGIGHIQGDICDWQKPIVLSTYQTLANRAEQLPEEIRRWFGLIIWDEVHHSSAPIFCRSVNLFYGLRLGLTATPERTDGTQIVYTSHIGKVLYKNLRQELTPSFQFIWTGLSLNMDDPQTRLAVVDKNSEIHLSKLATYLGRWRERLDKIIALVQEHERAGRKTMVLSNTVGELVNLLALYNQKKELYTDIAPPTPEEFDSELTPMAVHKIARARMEVELKRAKLALFDKNLNATKKEHIKKKLIPHIEARIRQHELAKEISRVHEKRQRAYVKTLIQIPSTAGLMIARVPTETRMHMLKTKRTIFTIYRYGLEGLDDAELDTIIAAEPMTAKNAIQQFVGRILRKGAREKYPLVQFLEDNIGPYIGMCKAVRRVLRAWPIDEGGPYKYELVGHPYMKEREPWKTQTRMMDGQSLSPAAESILGESW